MTTEADAELDRLFLVVVEDLEYRGYRAVGVLRRVRQRFGELAEFVESASPGSCPMCGGPVVQPPTGRRRVYCGRLCKNRANKGAKRPRNSTMAP
jgi:hypothetical protein